MPITAAGLRQRGVQCRRGLGVVDTLAVGRVFEATPGRQPEVEHANPPVLSDDRVVGLEVAVDDVGRVGCCEAATSFEIPTQDLAPAAAVALPRLERDPADVLHRHEELPLVLTDFEHGHHVGMAELGQSLGLARHSRA